MTNHQSISNSEKVLSGREVKDDVNEILTSLSNSGLISGYERDVSFSHEKFSYEKQYKADFIIKTIDEKYIIIRASNSYRSDRAKIACYDFIGIQNYSKFSGDIVASILLFRDTELNESGFLQNRLLVSSGEYYTPASHWLVFSEFVDYINNYKSEVCSSEDGLEDNIRYISEYKAHNKKDFSSVLVLKNDKSGSYYGKVGNMLESYIVNELNCSENLKQYKISTSNCVEFDMIVDKILSELKLEKSEISHLHATDTIKILKNLGAPKADIHVKVYTGFSCYQYINISVKNTGSDKVSCHDYRAKDFCRVIAPQDEDFCNFINLFQEAGSWTAFDTLNKSRSLNINADEALRPYMSKIIEWAITGEHDDNVTDKSTQVANLIFTRNAKDGSCKLKTAQDYIGELAKSESKGRGSPFSWTYPSGSRGERIQLKMPIKW